MRGRLFTLCSALSLLLCVVVCVLWVRSYFQTDIVIVRDRPPGTARFAESAFGGLSFYSVQAPVAEAGERTGARWESNSSSLLGTGGLLTFDAGWVRVPSERALWVVFPHWSLGCAAALLPAVAIRRRMGRRSRPGLCPACGYDLRATPDRCPECGAERKEGFA